MKRVLVAMCLVTAMACEREAEVDAVSATSATIDPGVTSTSATVDPSAEVEIDREWGLLADWDTDRDDRIGEQEFGTRFGNVYDRWDLDHNASLSRDEMADTWYDLWDGNDDNIVDEQEWTRPSEGWDFDGVDWNTWRDWDVDNDGRLAENEFDTRFTPIYERWDTDSNGVTRDELRDTWWDMFDNNNDNFVDSTEWTRNVWP